MTKSGVLKRLLCLGLVFGFTASMDTVAQGGKLVPGQWPIEEVWKWYNSIGPIKGCNYNPRTSVNSTEMWQAETFDPETIDQELGWARGCGYNNIRVFLQFLVWMHDPDGTTQRMDQFLQIADKHKIKVMFVPFCDCQFSGVEPYLGPQKDPVPGVHNGQWMASPGHESVTDKAVWPYLEQYIKAIVGRFGRDDRVLIWDLYNEPYARGIGAKSLPLAEAAFAWARETKPQQPLTIGAWTNLESRIQQRLMELSDVLSFHGYDRADGLLYKIKICSSYGRPIICTECLTRVRGSSFDVFLPIFAEHKIGWYNWGLVAGRTQTYMPWGSKPNDPAPKVWHHDILSPDGTPHNPAEIPLIRRFSFHKPKVLLPTSISSEQTWKYTFDEPEAGWQKASFDDSNWKKGQGPFGTSDIATRKAKTEWKTAAIWLRKMIHYDPNVKFNTATLKIHHDEDVEVYLNSQLIYEDVGYLGRLTAYDVTESLEKALRPGTNLLAVKCVQTTGGQYIDLGIGLDPLYPVTEPSEPKESVKRGRQPRWPAKRARQWFNSQPWPCGFNYIPANAISYTEMWMPYAYDTELIDKELALAEGVGFNCLRVVLPFVVWEHDPTVFTKRLESFLSICDKRGIKVMFTLFDDCAFGSDEKLKNPTYGHQPEVLEGWYANGWTPSPGHDMVRDPKTWPRLERYVKDVISTFKDDARVWVWDLYNEPTNGGLGNTSIPLVEEVFRWARDVKPLQPLTVGQWNGDEALNRVIFANSDIITFHDYSAADHLAKHIASLAKYGRPIINTEWLNRGRGSLAETCLPVFAREKVGCMHWGLVNGKTQTHLNWGHRPGQPDPPVWQHDLYHQDHHPYNTAELELFRKTICENVNRWSISEQDRKVQPDVTASQKARASVYRGWRAYVLENGLVQLHVVPDIGGRVIQYALGEKEFFWINPALLGKTSPKTGLDPDDGWLNYGGDKLWPAPQGWDNDQQWPGPPDAVLDGQPYYTETDLDPAGIRLTSRDDRRSGIRFSRRIRLYPRSTCVSVEATMTNIDNKPRRWGIWAHTQLDAGLPGSDDYNRLMRAWCPINPRSHFDRGYRVIFGGKDNPSFEVDAKRALMKASYRYKVGKIGLDSHAGWVATVDGRNGDVFVQRFTYEPDKAYPDESSVEFWHNGVGRIRAYNDWIDMSDNHDENPYVFESEVLSPFAQLQPGESYTWTYEWYACRIGGDFPVVDCSEAGVVSEPLECRRDSGRMRLRGRFGVFHLGQLALEAYDEKTQVLATEILDSNATPLKPVVLDRALELPAAASSVAVVLKDLEGTSIGEVDWYALSEKSR